MQVTAKLTILKPGSNIKINSWAQKIEDVYETQDSTLKTYIFKYSNVKARTE